MTPENSIQVTDQSRTSSSISNDDITIAAIQQQFSNLTIEQPRILLDFTPTTKVQIKRHWHTSVKKEQRTTIIKNLFQVICCSKTLPDNTKILRLISHVKIMEADIYDKAITEMEYCHMITEIMCANHARFLC